jgi:adenylate cyclase
VLFADVRGYTSIAERTEPEALMSWLNTFMSSMADEVIRHGGVIDDYAGDGIKADFGVPLQRRNGEGQAEDAKRAVACAIAMAIRLEELNERFEADGLPPIRVRIGIASGLAVAGSVGSRDRLKYTVVGDVVNRAARLEALDKEYDAGDGLPCRILIDQPTSDAVAGQFDCRPLGAVHLKGKESPVEVYQVRTLRTSEHRDA